MFVNEQMRGQYKVDRAECNCSPLKQHFTDTVSFCFLIFFPAVLTRWSTDCTGLAVVSLMDSCNTKRSHTPNITDFLKSTIAAAF